MKVYVNYEGLRQKISLKKKWVEEKVVRDILELFVENYNNKNKDIPLDIAELVICETSGMKIDLQAKIGDAIQDYQDLVVHEKKEKEAVAPFVQAVMADGGAAKSEKALKKGSKKPVPGNTVNRFDYDKWDNLDLSDDEKDFHPNVDNNLMIRLKREKREQMRAEEDQQIARLEKEGTEEAKKEIERILEERAARGLCGDDLCQDAWSHTSVNREESNFGQIQKAKQEKAKQGGKEEIDESSYTDFREQHYNKMEHFAKLEPDKSEDFIRENPEVLQEEAAGHMLIYMLNLEMAGKTFQMKKAVRQYLMLQNILDLAKQSKQDPRAAVAPFFREILQPEKLEQLKAESEGFAEKIRKRAIDKKAEMDAEEEDEEEVVELSREERLGPGGLDPVEVFETLPEVMQKAFESKSTDALQEAVSQMTEEQAKYHMKRCADSGLWVPGPSAEVE